MGNTKRNGILALLGLGALAWWKYKKSSPEQQQALKDQLNTAKDNFNKWGSDLKNKASEVAGQVQNKAEALKNKVKDQA